MLRVHFLLHSIKVLTANKLSRAICTFLVREFVVLLSRPYKPSEAPLRYQVYVYAHVREESCNCKLGFPVLIITLLLTLVEMG